MRRNEIESATVKMGISVDVVPSFIRVTVKICLVGNVSLLKLSSFGTHVMRSVQPVTFHWILTVSLPLVRCGGVVSQTWIRTVWLELTCVIFGWYRTPNVISRQVEAQSLKIGSKYLSSSHPTVNEPLVWIGQEYRSLSEKRFLHMDTPCPSADMFRSNTNNLHRPKIYSNKSSDIWNGWSFLFQRQCHCSNVGSANNNNYGEKYGWAHSTKIFDRMSIRSERRIFLMRKERIFHTSMLISLHR